MLSREDILRKTHYGTGIYSAILREQYPEDEVVMRIVGRDCGLCRNPYADGMYTLHIWHERINSEETLSLEIARHHDESGSIPDGDCFDFAARYYGLEDQDLLEKINEDLFLHINESQRQYPEPASIEVPQPTFSFFKAPVRNIIPERTLTLKEAWLYITGDIAKARTETLRSIDDKKSARAYKAQHFDYACFCGTFSRRSDDAILQPSGLLCIDFDHLPEPDATKQLLLQDDYFDTALLFRSPSGDGIKWIIEITDSRLKHADYFQAVSAYLQEAYHLETDKSGKDVSRACFLPFDPEAFLNPQYM